MKNLFSIALVAALCAPVSAQRMGMANNDAPTIKQTIMAGAAKISLDYTSITWARGEMMSQVLDKANGANARKNLNTTGPKKPLASFSTSVDVTLGDIQIPAGDYQVYFTITEELVWQINFQGKDKTLTTKLNVSNEGEHESKRLLLCLHAADEDVGVYVAFGKQSGMLTFKTGTGKAASDAKAGK
jgi:hypothetical protein